MRNTPESSEQTLSLPKGGGTLQGIGETFQPNLFSGTGNFNIPIFTSPGRAGFGPQLSLQYSTGNGNGIFGLGWNLSVPRITRKTEKGLPRYNNEDVFVLSGAEDLVPKLKRDDPQAVDCETITHGIGSSLVKFRITPYLPRTEGLFARIESWEELDPTGTDVVTDVFWRVTTKENVTSIYGRTPDARITDPENDTHIFEWLLEETFDSKGNHISYGYARDDFSLPLDQIQEQNRSYAQVYPRRILYGNVPDQLSDYHGNQFSAGVTRPGTDHRDPLKKINRRYIFEVFFDFGDTQHPQTNTNPFVYQAPDAAQETLNSAGPVREDPFSSFRPGFELRTMRRCSNVLMIHHFRELGGATLVKSTDFNYTPSPGTQVSLLTGATVTGYVKSANGDYTYESMPPVIFKYSEFRPKHQRYQTIKAKDGNLPAVSLNDPNTALVDLFGNGLQDIVQSTPAGFRYWRNQGNAELDSPHAFHESPAGLALADAGVAFGDMGGDGLADLIVSQGPVSGFFELQAEHEVGGQLIGGWSTQSFRPFPDHTAMNLSDPNLRMLDLTGDGLTDLLVTTDRELIWYQSKGEQGYSDQKHTAKKHGLEHLFFNDPSGRVRLADMSGDGLNDIIWVHNGRMDYWPNLGYGRFGKRLTMSGNTRLPLAFDPRRLFLADLDGSGTADLVYVDFNEVHFWFNQSGNSWSERQTIDGTPITLDTTALSFTDFHGTGTTCLLWSYDFGTLADGNYKVLDFCGGTKPYLLTEMDNNLGATTRVRYAASTQFYLEDTAQGNFWATPLPFPVQVVEKTESIDHIGKTKLVTAYRYHHGYYDGREREFRGFGRVDQIDSEYFDIFEKKDLHAGSEFENKDRAHHVPPVETRTWFHTGAYFEHCEILKRYRSEYLSGIEKLGINQRPTDPDAFDLGAHDIQVQNPDLQREAHRALRGSILRTEIYAHDDSTDKNFPYMVSEQTYRVQTKQEKGPNAHPVLLSTAKDKIGYHYERRHNGRNLIDPRVQQDITMAVDDFGNPTQSAGIAYRRRQTDFTEQDSDLISIIGYDYVNPLQTRADFRHSAVAATTQYEITGLNRSRGSAYALAALTAAFTSAQEIGYAEQPTSGLLQKRRLNHQITLFWQADLSGSEAIGKTAFHGLPYETYQLALTPGLRQSIFGNNRLTHTMGIEGGYRKKTGDTWLPAGSGDWWIPSGVQTLDSAHFYLATEIIDPFGNTTSIQYDPYHLFPVRMTDPLDNIQEGLIDYRVLHPFLMRDINGNHSEVAFNALGLVVGTAVMGKSGRNPSHSLLGINDNEITQMRDNTEADSLEGFDADPPDHLIRDLMADTDGDGRPAYSAGNVHPVLKKATRRIVYDLHRYRLKGAPAVVCTITREVHAIQAGDASPLQLAYAYTDGCARVVQHKKQTAAGDDNRRRWVASGWTIFNNKGKPVQQYEPFFSDTRGYQPDNTVGVSSTLFYDPLQRLICTIHPNNTYEKIRFTPWQQISWDSNDTVLLDPRNDPDVSGYVSPYISSLGSYQTWNEQRIPDPTTLPAALTAQQKAAIKTIEHTNTPAVTHLDAQGNTFLTIADNKTETLTTKVEIDIEGNDLSVTDPRGIQAFAHQFDMAGRKLGIISRDAGHKRLFWAVDGQPLYHWDAVGNRVNTGYDELRRPADTWVRKADGTLFLSEKRFYGESRSQASMVNARGSLWKHYDGAGLALNQKIDFKGNVLEPHRRLLADGSVTEVQWPINAAGDFDETAAVNLLEANTRLNTTSYASTQSYDALNRVTQSRLPNGTFQTPFYNPAGLLESLSVKLPNRNQDRIVENIDYNAKGQRQKIAYGNGVTTSYEYEPDTFRLQGIESTRNSPAPKTLQQLQYAYDPVGNITSIRDDAHSKVFNRNQAIVPENRYTYDAVYRLIEASGREHEAMTACHYRTNSKKNTELLPLPQSTANAQALITYLEKYRYDKSGNIERIEHSNSLRSTIRTQTYDMQSNRIVTSIAGCPNENNPIPHDANGNITKPPHLPKMGWDFKNQLIDVQLNLGPTPNHVYYQYDSQGQRIRKTIVKNNGSHISERIYLGAFEIYTETVSNNVQTRRDTLHISDDQQLIAIVETEKDVASGLTISTTNRFQLSNHIGSSSLELDENAHLISYEEYYPYGGTAYMAGRDIAETSLKRYRYSGKERDDETGMYYYGARYYAPWIGRWFSCDPLIPGSGHNGFAFCRQNPIVRKDSDGLADENTVSPADQVHSGSDDPFKDHKSALVSQNDINREQGLPAVGNGRFEGGDPSYAVSNMIMDSIWPTTRIRAQRPVVPDVIQAEAGFEDIMDKVDRRNAQRVTNFGSGVRFFANKALTVELMLLDFVGGAAVAVYTTHLSAQALTNSRRALIHSSDEMFEFLVSKKASLTNAEKGPVLTSILDTKTGQVFHGLNIGKKGALPTAQEIEYLESILHPVLLERVRQQQAILSNAASLGTMTRYQQAASVPGTHSEIIALNKAILAREEATGMAFTAKELNSLMVYNRSLSGGRIGSSPPACFNCDAISSGASFLFDRQYHGAN